jgi:hypothetical protein
MGRGEAIRAYLESPRFNAENCGLFDSIYRSNGRIVAAISSTTRFEQV